MFARRSIVNGSGCGHLCNRSQAKARGAEGFSIWMGEPNVNFTPKVHRVVIFCNTCSVVAETLEKLEKHQQQIK